MTRDHMTRVAWNSVLDICAEWGAEPLLTFNAGVDCGGYDNMAHFLL